MNKIIAFFMITFVVGCANWGGEAIYPEQIGINKWGEPGTQQPGIFGTNGIAFGNVGGDEENVSGLKINSFLWRASLDTVSFMPIASVDPFGGVILTDWYIPEENKNERYKLNVMIMSSTLRADGVKVSAFKEIKGKNGKWQETKSDSEIASKIENAILTKARELKVSQ